MDAPRDPHLAKPTPQRSSPKPDVAEMRRALELLFETGAVVELRAVDAVAAEYRTPHIASGYYDDTDALIRDAAKMRAMGVYVTANVINPALLARANNRMRHLRRGEPTTSDADVTRRRWFVIDLDPKRPAGICATEAEHDAALRRAFDIRDALRSDGWPDPLTIDTGNGVVLLYCVDLPADDGGLSKRVLEALDFRFSDSAVVVDASTHNAGQLVRLPGTANAKGDNTAERPHRLVRLIDLPNPITVVSRELLETVAASTPTQLRAPSKAHGKAERERFDLDAWITRHNLDVVGPTPWGSGRKWVFAVCPWNDAHRNQSAYIVQFGTGAIAAGCHHNGCRGHDWHALRDLVEPGWRDKDRDDRSIHASPGHVTIGQALARTDKTHGSQPGAASGNTRSSATPTAPRRTNDRPPSGSQLRRRDRNDPLVTLDTPVEEALGDTTVYLRAVGVDEYGRIKARFDCWHGDRRLNWADCFLDDDSVGRLASRVVDVEPSINRDALVATLARLAQQATEIAKQRAPLFVEVPVTDRLMLQCWSAKRTKEGTVRARVVVIEDGKTVCRQDVTQQTADAIAQPFHPRLLPSFKSAAAQLFAALEQHPSLETDDESATASRFRLLSAKELLSLPPVEWLVHHHVPKKGVVVMYGPSGNGKTFIALDLTLSISTGRAWHRISVEQGTVVYIAGEGTAGISQRVAAWMQARKVGDLGDVRFLCQAVQFLEQAQVDALLGELRRLPKPPVLIVVDTLARSMVGGDENSARDMGLFISAVDRLRTELDTAVMVLHHTGKDGAIERGSSSLRAAADTMIVVRKGDGTITFACEKQKDGAPEFPKQQFTLVSVALGDDVTSCVVELASPQNEAGVLTENQRELLEVLHTCFGADGATNSEWRKACQMPDRTYYRAKKSLVEGAYVASVGDGSHQRYTLTEKGKAVVTATAKLLPRAANGSATTPPPSLPATATPLRGGSGSSRGSDGKAKSALASPSSEAASQSPQPLFLNGYVRQDDLLRLAAEQDWQLVPLADGDAIGPGEASWQAKLSDPTFPDAKRQVLRERLLTLAMLRPKAG